MSIGRSTALVITSRILVLFAGLIISVIAAHTLSVVEQGYFFTFLSIAAAQTLFELGITNLILHHLSHARANISSAETEKERKVALGVAQSTRAYSSRYFRRAAGLFTIFVGLGGAAFFSSSPNPTDLYWQLPWVLMIFGTALGLFNLTYFSHLEAFGYLNVSYQVRIISTAILVVVFILHAYSLEGLTSYPLALLVANVYANSRLRRTCAEVDQKFELKDGDEFQVINIGREQRKMAASAVAGYVTANALTPYTFHFFGAESAGQVGLTMSIFAAIAAVSMARTTAEAPAYGPLVAAGDFTTLKKRFLKTLLFSTVLAVVLGILVVVARQIGLALFPDFKNRVLNVAGFSVVGLLIVANVALSVTGTVLRAFKTEQLMWPSLIAAALVLMAQLGLRLDPVQCLALLAAFNGLIFYPFAQLRLITQLSNRHV